MMSNVAAHGAFCVAWRKPLSHLGTNMFVLAGTSGTGKTMLLEELKSRGFLTHSEVTRAVLQDQVAQNGDALPSKNPSLFVAEMLRISIQNYEASMAHRGPVFFDRGVPDLVAYAQRFNVDTNPYIEAAEQYRYNQVCFLLPPWREIYTKDEWRGGEYEFYEKFHHSLTHAYQSLGYSLVEVPRFGVTERADFVMEIVQGNNA
jgi:predicted ATPase